MAREQGKTYDPKILLDIWEDNLNLVVIDGKLYEVLKYSINPKTEEVTILEKKLFDTEEYKERKNNDY